MKLPLIFLLVLPLVCYSQKGPRSAGITLSFPWVNSYVYYDYKTSKNASVTGFFGIGGSVFYKEGSNKVSLNAGYTSSLPVPIGPFCRDNEVPFSEVLASFLEVIYHKNIYKRINLITGVSYVRHEYLYHDYLNPSANLAEFDRTVGITLGGEYHFTGKFTGAIFYRPAIVSIDRKQYWHLISIDGRIDLRFWKRK
ncbi:MAG TPA: hypothetical protein VFZ47_11385 [Chitinophagaceae bacterium]